MKTTVNWRGFPLQRLFIKSDLPFPFPYLMLLHNQGFAMLLLTQQPGRISSLGWMRSPGFPFLHQTKLVQWIFEPLEKVPTCGSPLGQRLVCLVA